MSLEIKTLLILKFTMKKTFFCYLDVLGFKEKLKDKSDSEQVDILNSLFGYISFSIPGNSTNQQDQAKSLINLDSINTSSILISDSILLWTNDCEYKNTIEFIYRIQRLIKNAFMGGFPLRGTIEYGSLYHIEKSIPTKTSYNHFDVIGGSALMDAFIEEQKLEWLGCTLSKTCLAEIKRIVKDYDQSDDSYSNELFKNKILVEYEVPKKSGVVEKYFTINWVDFIVTGYYKKQEIKDIFLKYTDLSNLAWPVKIKIDNTNENLKYIIENNWGNQYTAS